MILFCHITRHIMSACTAIEKARFDGSVKVENSSYTLLILCIRMYAWEYKKAIVLSVLLQVAFFHIL